MKMLKIINGDLLKSTEDIIIHQCNAQGVMGSGVAKQIATLYPEVEEEYKEFISNCSKTNRNPLGTSCYVMVKNKYSNKEQCVANIIGQFNYGRDGRRYTDYRALFTGILDALRLAENNNANVALPYKIGCFRGGGDWDNIVYPFLQTVSEDFNGDIVIYRLDRN